MKRDIFTELVEGFESLSAEREGIVKLRHHKKVTKRDMGEIAIHAKIVPFSANEVKQLRESLNLSQPVLASYLRVNPRTLQNWEQGKSKPNDQASVLMRMVKKDKKVLKLLEEV